MRIISKRPDYYDTALAYGHDDHVVYVRETVEYRDQYRKQEIPEEFNFLFSEGYYSVERQIEKPKRIKLNLDMFSVAFCGIVYRGIMVTIIDRSMSGETESHFFYDLPSLEKYLKPHGFEFKTKPKMGFEKKWWKQNTNRYTKLSYRDAIEKFFEDAVSDQHRDFFIERKLPVVACHPTIYDDRWSSNPVHDALLVVNPLLSHWEFYKVMDAYTAFQELEMFLGGVMAGEDNPMAGISDEDLAKAKGYDCYSFKKPPTKRLPKGCK